MVIGVHASGDEGADGSFFSKILSHSALVVIVVVVVVDVSVVLVSFGFLLAAVLLCFSFFCWAGRDTPIPPPTRYVDGIAVEDGACLRFLLSVIRRILSFIVVFFLCSKEYTCVRVHSFLSSVCWFSIAVQER